MGERKEACCSLQLSGGQARWHVVLRTARTYAEPRMWACVLVQLPHITEAASW